MWKQIRIPVGFAVAHTIFLLFMWVNISMSDDSVAVMGWIIFEYLDWPASSALFPAANDDWPFVVGLLLFGGLQWLVIGTVMQLLMNIAFPIRDKKDAN